ncbi:hypothetical protein PAXRUDRAFT_170398 [Paxillus rubicundulus Ve08.2h10]|uniref:HAT C-terminal dimerisation domain-containing protein n=1 Tax=Paxillus rubicundulus Ve08.2h10 TaxID=930991 RepID=A0A0D0CLV8_9AGAM|nr:hypothetical protein PAXRUDRAFT_170398 [Paxillus rubicundulus Ve08.2h10]
MNEASYPTLLLMAMYYLPIQGSAVPCEHIFSSSVEMDTKKRNYIQLALMEALQILKSFYKKSHLNFSAGLLKEKDLEEAGPEDPLTKLFMKSIQQADRSLNTLVVTLGINLEGEEICKDKGVVPKEDNDTRS